MDFDHFFRENNETYQENLSDSQGKKPKTQVTKSQKIQSKRGLL